MLVSCHGGTCSLRLGGLVGDGGCTASGPCGLCCSPSAAKCGHEARAADHTCAHAHARMHARTALQLVVTVGVNCDMMFRLVGCMPMTHACALGGGAVMRCC